MSILKLESRPTSPVKIAKAIAVGVAVAVPLMLFGAPLLVRYQAATLSIGDTVAISYQHADGSGTAEDCIVDAILDDGTVRVTTAKSGKTLSVPRAAVEELW